MSHAGLITNIHKVQQVFCLCGLGGNLVTQPSVSQYDMAVVGGDVTAVFVCMRMLARQTMLGLLFMLVLFRGQAIKLMRTAAEALHNTIII